MHLIVYFLWLCVALLGSRPVAEAVSDLKDFINEHGGNPAIGKAIRLLGSGRGRPIESLKDLTFSQYRTIIFSKTNWPRFETVFDSMRELVDADFEDVNKLRNVVFHFRRGITPKDTDRLRRFRDRLRYDRNLYLTQEAGRRTISPDNMARLNRRHQEANR